MKKILLVVNILNLLGCCWLLVKLLFNYVGTPYILEYGGFYLFFVTWVVEFILEKRWKRWQWNYTTGYFILLIVFFLLSIIYAPFDSEVYFKHLLEKRYALFGFGIVGLFGLNKYYKLSYCFNVMIITSILTICYLVFFRIGFVPFITFPERAILLANARIASVNAHMGFNLYLNLSLIGIWYICTHSWHRLPHWKRYGYGAALLVIFYILSQSEGRSGFLASIVLMFSFIVLEIWKRRKILGLLVVLLLPFILFAASSHHARMSTDKLHSEPRLMLWHAAVEKIEDDKPVFGYGMSRAQEEFDKVNMKYISEEYCHYWLSFKPYFIDTHNQYLQTFLEFGIIGLLLLLVLYTAPVFLVAPKRRILTVLICGLCAYQSMFDMFITGQFCPLFCLLMLFLLKVKDDVQPRCESGK